MRTITQTKKRTVVNMCVAVLMAAGVWQVAHAERNDDDNSRNSLRVIGLTDTGRLVSFRARSPERTRDLGYVTGLTGADMALVGIDFRVQDGKLYGVGNGGGVYTIDPENRRGDIRQRTHGASERNGVWRGLQSGCRSPADHQRHRTEPCAQRERRRRDPRQRHTDIYGSPSLARACTGRHGGRLHEQRSESAEYGHDVVRPGYNARSGRHSIASGQRHPGRHREARG